MSPIVLLVRVSCAEWHENVDRVAHAVISTSLNNPTYVTSLENRSPKKRYGITSQVADPPQRVVGCKGPCKFHGAHIVNSVVIEVELQGCTVHQKQWS